MATRYRDVNLDFPNTNQNDVFQGKDIVLSGADAVKAGLINLLRTERGTKLMDRNFGVQLNRFLHRQISEETADDIMDEIRESVREFDPRVQLVPAGSTIIPVGKSYRVHLEYIVLPDNQVDSLDITLNNEDR